MISLHNILSIAKYERKTLLRSWFFRIFGILSLLVLFGMNFRFIIEGGGSESWVISSITSAIPYFNLLILNVAQAIIAVFLASDFLKRDKKLDTTEVIYMRSMTNGEYVIGKTWGNLQVFLVLNIVVIAMALVFNLLAQGTSVDVASYGYYLVLISIPTLVFIMGLSFLLMSIIRNQAITFVVILGYIGITLFLVQAKFYYLFDYMAFNIPLLNSDIVGFGNLAVILGHRGIYLSLGLGFIFLSIFMLKRLPQSEAMTYISLILSILFIGIGGYLGYSHINTFKINENLRAEAIELNNKYVSVPVPEIVSNSISLEHKGKIISVSSTIKLKNTTAKELDKLIFSLNSGLEVKSLKLNGEEISYLREHHLVIINDNVDIAPGSEATIEVQYEGSINEALCYLDIDEKTMQEKHGLFVINVDKRFAFIEPEYVLLTKETNWYPKPGVTYSTTDVKWNQPQFSTFHLQVKTNHDLVAVSQGAIKEVFDGQYVFENENPLTQISLSIGNYKHVEVEEGDVTFGIYYFEGHDHFSENLSEIKDTIPSVISERLEDFARIYNLEYSFKRLSIVEVPAQFKTYERIWTSNQELIQPEQILIPEKGFLLRDADFKGQMKRQERYGRHDDESLTPDQLQLRALNNFFGTFTQEQGRPDWNRMRGGAVSVEDKASPYFIFSMLYNFQNNIQSESWPIVNRIFEAYLKSQSNEMGSSWMRNMSGISEDELANIALQDFSFEEILADVEQKKIIDNVIKLKGDVLFSMIQWKAGQEEFENFSRNILRENKFKNIPFASFDNQINENFGIELTPLMDEWFQEKSLPGYLISPFSAVKVKSEDQIQTMVSFKITNFSEKEGIVKVSFRLGSSRGRGHGGERGMGRGEIESVDKVIYLEPNQTKDISYLLDADPRMMTINTLTSKNIPQTLTEGFREIEEDFKVKPFDGEKISDSPVDMLLKNETIVDNEDPGFEITTDENESLLKKWVLKEDENKLKYSGMNPWRPPTSWTLITNSDLYGEYVRSGYYIKSGDGSQKAKWTIPVKEAGYYDVYYHLFKPRSFRRGRSEEKGEYHFTIHHDDGEEEQSLEIQTAEDGWNHLGSYYFSPESAIVELSNLSELRTVNADAVKIIKL